MREITVTDSDLEAEVVVLQQAIRAWATKHELWYDCGFQTYAERVDGEPGTTPVVTILHFDGELGRALDGDFENLDVEFHDLLEKLGYWYERNDGVSAHIYPADESPLFQSFLDYSHWQWVCGLVKPDISDVYDDLYSHFAERPEDLHRLDPRKFEVLLSKIFQNRGFESELGPGSGDGGIDLRLLQRDPMGDILTVVQAKRYAAHRKIQLGPVQALHGAADVENAQRSLFVTTSEYLPSARSFAGRTRIPMELATSKDVRDWCRDASNGIINDKSKLVSPLAVSRLLQNLAPKDPRIVHAHTGYSVMMNQFAIVLKETEHAALLMTVPSRTVSDDGYGQMGFEVPDLGLACLDRLNADTVFRAKRSVRDKQVSYWNGHNLFQAWDGQAMHFNLCD